MSPAVRLSLRLRAFAVLLVLVPGAACAKESRVVDVGPGQVAVDTERAVETFARAHGFEGLARATVQLGAVELEVVVANTSSARERGLQGVDDVPVGVGMLFILPEPSGPRGSPGFWMSGVLVPLDIAFASDGTVVSVVTMQPCPARPCPITHPGVDYDVAIEVAAGELARAGVGPGDRLTWEPAAR